MCITDAGLWCGECKHTLKQVNERSAGYCAIRDHCEPTGGSLGRWEENKMLAFAWV